MRDRGETDTMKNPKTDLNPHCDDDQHFRGDPRGDPRGVPQDCWMRGGGRGRRRAMMAMMMTDPSGMDHGQFDFGCRGGGGGGRGRGGWFGFGGRGRGFGGRCRGGHDSSASSSSSSSSESDDEEHAPDDDVQKQQPCDGEVSEKEGQSKDQSQLETTKSNATEGETDQPSSDQSCYHGHHGRRHWRGHHHHGKHMHHHHHHHHQHARHHEMLPPMHQSHHGVPHCHGNRKMAKKFFKRSMKKWYKAEKRAWKHQQGGHCCHRLQRSDGDEAVTSGCDNDDDIAHPENQYQLPPPWLFFAHDHHGHGRHGCCRHGKKGKKHGKRLRRCNCEQPGPADDTKAQTTSNAQEDFVDEVEILDDDQAPMDDVAE